MWNIFLTFQDVLATDSRINIEDCNAPIFAAFELIKHFEHPQICHRLIWSLHVSNSNFQLRRDWFQVFFSLNRTDYRHDASAHMVWIMLKKLIGVNNPFGNSQYINLFFSSTIIGNSISCPEAHISASDLRPFLTSGHCFCNAAILES